MINKTDAEKEAIRVLAAFDRVILTETSKVTYEIGAGVNGVSVTIEHDLANNDFLIDLRIGEVEATRIPLQRFKALLSIASAGVDWIYRQPYGTDRSHAAQEGIFAKFEGHKPNSAFDKGLMTEMLIADEKRRSDEQDRREVFDQTNALSNEDDMQTDTKEFPAV